ncbi:MAG TPA: polysaccharide biosynthesis tyrosine autokinase, partial [Flavitalea sp.]|nr:polysaccharide biosynthesis tyrosine autokinase [Flavitalea sp.]
IRLRDDVPQRGENILNELVKAYQNQSMKVKDSMASNTLSFIDARIREVTQDLHDIEAKVQQYKSNKGIVNLSEQGQLFLQNVGNNDRRLSDISVQSAALDQIENYITNKNSTGFVPSSMGITDPVLTQLLQKLYDNELQYERLRKTTDIGNPMMVALSNEIENMRPKILETVRSNRKALQASQGDINSTNTRYSTMLQSIPQKERELVEISRQQTIKNDVYAFLLRKREETALLQVSNVSDTRAVDSAESSIDPVSPKAKIIFPAAIMLALLIGIAYVSYKEFMNSKVLFRSQIEDVCSIPIVAEIAKSTSKNSLVVNDPEMVVLSEQFRHLRAAIGIFGKITKKKRILVTSSISGEGKSFIANNLALSLAMSGRKVVMMDMDLRNPKTSSVFKMSGKKGMAEYLEEGFEPSSIIYNTEFENLFVIPAGTAEQNATELMLHGNLRELMEYLETTFDYVIMDAAPVDPVTDAYVLSDFVTTTLYVVRHNYTPETMVEMLDQNSKVKTLKNLAIVFNGIKPRGVIMKGYGYGYGYGYNNVYGNKQYASKQHDTKA